MKNLIKKWLGITALEKENNFLKEQIRSYLEVSVDVHSNPRNAPSWAVVCLRGKRESLKFYGADDRTINNIANWLRQFNRENRMIDAHPQCKDFLRRVI